LSPAEAPKRLPSTIMTRTLVIAPRFAGPPRSGNGGYVCGQLATYLHEPAARVSLRKPPPLDVPLTVDDNGSDVILRGPAGVIAVGSAASVGAEPPPAIDVGTAKTAEPRFRGWHGHPFPGCFVCGPERAIGDGLRLFPGPLSDSTRTVACAWQPDRSLADSEDPAVVSSEFVWAALDCPGAWTSDLENRPLVLGTMTAALEGAVEVDRSHIVVGQLRGIDGRKTLTTTALYDTDGRLLARAEQVWIAVDPATFGAL
jgi:hypothetical protein